MNRKLLRNFHRDPGSESGGGAVETSASAGAASAQPAGGADSAGGGESTDGGLASSPASSGQSASVDLAALEARFEAGETLSEAEMEAYENAIMAGTKSEENPEEAQPEEPGEDEPAQGDEGGKTQVAPELEAAMKETGAKTVEELPVKVRALRAALSQQGQQVSQATKLLTDLAEGKPEAIAHFEKISGKPFPIQGQGQGQGQPQQFETPAGLTQEMFIPQELIDASLEPEVLKAINANISRVLKSQAEAMSPYIKQMEEARVAADLERTRSRVTDNLVEIASKYSDVYGAAGAGVRDLVAQYVSTGVVDPRIEPLIETAQYMLQNNLPSIEAAHKVLHFDKVRTGAVEREIAARRETVAKIAGVKPTVGLVGKANQSAAEYSEADVTAIISGKKEAPAEWFDSSGLPIRSRMPAKAYKAFVG